MVAQARLLHAMCRDSASAWLTSSPYSLITSVSPGSDGPLLSDGAEVRNSWTSVISPPLMWPIATKPAPLD